MDTTGSTTFLRVSSACRPAAKLYSLSNIRPVGKGGYSTASMINNFGQVVGHAAEEAKAVTRAYAWSSEHGLVPDLGSVYSQGSFATNINDKGVIVGYVSTDNSSLRAFLLGHGQMYDLGLLSSVEFDEAFSVATDINEAGRIVGYSHNADNNLHAYIWDHETGMVDLGSLGAGRSYAYAINDAGFVVGWSQVDDNRGYRAFGWQDGSGMQELPGKDTGATVAYGVNNFGVVCGAAASGVLGNTLQGVVWTTGGMVETGTIYGMAFSAGYSINNVGQVVGWSYPKAQCDLKLGRAIVWDQVRGIQDLNDLIPKDSGWLLHKATGVNDDGEIVGCGTFEGRQQSFLLTPEDYAREVTKFLDLQQLNLITNQKTGVVYRTIMIRNNSHKTIKGPLQLVFKGLSPGIAVVGAAGEIDTSPIRTVKTDQLTPNSQLSTTIQFSNPQGRLINYEIECYSGSF